MIHRVRDGHSVSGVHRSATRWCAFAAAAVTALIATTTAAAASRPPRLEGKFRTVLTLTRVVGAPQLKAGDSGLGTWTFRPQCAHGVCTTVLVRPARQAGSTAAYVHDLVPVSPTEYRGHSQSVLTACVFPDGKRIAGGYRTTQTIVLHVSGVTAGRVAAYSGTQDTRGTSTTTGREHGCPAASEQYASFRSAGRR
jgi:hypothetical protein